MTTKTLIHYTKILSPLNHSQKHPIFCMMQTDYRSQTIDLKTRLLHK